MWSHFFEKGGWGMYPTIVFGFLLLAATALHALRPQPRFQRTVNALGVVTFASGLLGTVVGICKSARYLDQVPPDQQFLIFATGSEESLHNLVLALIIIVIAALIAAVSSFRQRGPQV